MLGVCERHKGGEDDQLQALWPECCARQDRAWVPCVDRAWPASGALLTDCRLILYMLEILRIVMVDIDYWIQQQEKFLVSILSLCCAPTINFCRSDTGNRFSSFLYSSAKFVFSRE